jgi:hypothetical protein
MSPNFPDLLVAFDAAVKALQVKLSQDPSSSTTYNGELIQSIAKDIEERWAPLQAMVQGRNAFETKSAMDASGAPPADKPLAEVWNDPTVTNNGLYGYSGSAWVKSPYDSLSAITKAIAAAEGFLDGHISRWEYVDAEAVKIYLDEPVYFKVKGSSTGRLPFPLEFELPRLSVAYVDDDIRDATTNELTLQIVSHADWAALTPSVTRRVVASNEYNGVWSSELNISSFDEAMSEAIQMGINLTDVKLASGGALDFYFGDGKTDIAFAAFKGAQGTTATIPAFTTNGKYTLEPNYGLYFDFGKAIGTDSFTIEKTPNVVYSGVNGHRAFVRGTKVLLLAGTTVENGTVPRFYGKLADQAYAIWASKAKINPIKSHALTAELPLTAGIKTKFIGPHDVEFTVPAFCYAAFPSNPNNPEAGHSVARTNQEHKVTAGENQIVFFDSRQKDAETNTYLVPQVMDVWDYSRQPDEMVYRKVLGWTRSSGWHGVTGNRTEDLEKKICLSHDVSLADVKTGTPRDGLTTYAIFIQPAPGSLWHVYTGYSMEYVEWSDDIKAEIAAYGYIEIKENQGIVCDFANVNASNRVIAYKVDEFGSGTLGRNDGGWLLLGYRRTNSRDVFYGQLKDTPRPFLNENVRPYYAQMDRVAFSQGNTLPTWNKDALELTWPDPLLLLSPWRDETGYRRHRVRIAPGTISFPSDNYYVAWINKEDLTAADDPEGVPVSKIKIGRYYEADGWQGAANVVVLGYCSYGNFTRVAFPPTLGTLEYPELGGSASNTLPDVVIDVQEPTSDLKRVLVNIRDDASDKGRYICWRFERLTSIDAEAGHNSDVWHLQRAYVVGADLSTIIKEVITGGENETAIKESGKADFVGGTAHGDEIAQWINMQLDGTEIDPTVAGRHIGKVFRVQQHSQGYEEGTQALTEWFKAWKTWEFSIDGVEITQQLEFQRDAVVSDWYNCFLCIARNEDENELATTAQFGAVEPYYQKEDLRARNRTRVEYPSPRKAISYGGGVSFSVEFLEGYGPQDPDNITFDPAENYMFFQVGGGNYNKMYFKQGFTNVLTGAKTFTHYRYKVNSDL